MNIEYRRMQIIAHPSDNQWNQLLANLRTSNVLSFSMFFVAIRDLLDLTQTRMVIPVSSSNSKSLSKKASLNIDDAFFLKPFLKKIVSAC